MAYPNSADYWVATCPRCRKEWSMVKGAAWTRCGACGYNANAEYLTRLESDLNDMQAEAEQHTQAYDDAAVLRVVAFCRAMLEAAAKEAERRIVEGDSTSEPAGLIR